MKYYKIRYYKLYTPLDRFTVIMLMPVNCIIIIMSQNLVHVHVSE